MNKTNTVILAILVALATTTGLVTALSMMSPQTAFAANGQGFGGGKGGGSGGSGSGFTGGFGEGGSCCSQPGGGFGGGQGSGDSHCGLGSGGSAKSGYSHGGGSC